MIANTPESDFERFSQLIFEFHYLFPSWNDFDYKIEAIKKLLKTHTPVHFHANGAGAYTGLKNTGLLGFPYNYEVTFANNKFFKFSANSEYLPLEADWVEPGIPNYQIGVLSDLL